VPTYQYACTECAHAFDQFQSFTDDTLTECPQCQGRLRKLFNAVGVVFKGSGFYRTDSRTGADTSDTAPSGKETSSGSESSGGTADSPKPSGSKDTSGSSAAGSTSSKGDSSGHSKGDSSGSSKSTASTGS